MQRALTIVGDMDIDDSHSHNRSHYESAIADDSAGSPAGATLRLRYRLKRSARVRCVRLSDLSELISSHLKGVAVGLHILALCSRRQSASARSKQVGTLPEDQHVVVLDMAVDEKGRKCAKIRTCTPDRSTGTTGTTGQDAANTSTSSAAAAAVGWVEVHSAGGVKLLEQVGREAGVDSGVAAPGEGSLSYSAVESLLGAQLRLGALLTRLASSLGPADSWCVSCFVLGCSLSLSLSLSL
jgi:hypothetical protein